MSIIEHLQNFTDIYHRDPNGRYQSYDHCRQSFLDNRDDKNKRDLITLNLYAYLASWGMLRNSFLMQKDYLFSRPVVDILCDSRYDSLVLFDPFEANIDSQLDLIMLLKKEIIEYYTGKLYISDDDGGEHIIDHVTDTLVSKIMLGTFGCVPAYDQYFVKALRQKGINGVFNKKSMLQIVEFANENKSEILDICNNLGPLYTPMKIIDMYFWEMGIR